MKTFMIVLDIIAVSIMLSLLWSMYRNYWIEKNKSRTPFDIEQERLMKTYKPESWDEEFDEDKFHDWRKYIFSQRNELLNDN